MVRKTKRAERIAAKLAECLKQGDGREDLAEKARRHFRAKGTAKRKYDEADRIAQELLATVGPAVEIPLSKKRKAKFRDNFAEKNVVYRAKGIRRYELEIVEL